MMPKAGVVPNCRYGHGNLGPPEIGDHDFGAFALQGLVVKNFGEAERYVAGDGGLLLQVFECPVCGYTELFERSAKP